MSFSKIFFALYFVPLFFKGSDSLKKALLLSVVHKESEMWFVFYILVLFSTLCLHLPLKMPLTFLKTRTRRLFLHYEVVFGF